MSAGVKIRTGPPYAVRSAVSIGSHQKSVDGDEQPARPQQARRLAQVRRDVDAVLDDAEAGDRREGAVRERRSRSGPSAGSGSARSGPAPSRRDRSPAGRGTRTGRARAGGGCRTGAPSRGSGRPARVRSRTRPRATRRSQFFGASWCGGSPQAVTSATAAAASASSGAPGSPTPPRSARGRAGWSEAPSAASRRRSARVAVGRVQAPPQRDLPAGHPPPRPAERGARDVPGVHGRDLIRGTLACWGLRPGRRTAASPGCGTMPPTPDPRAAARRAPNL